MFETLTQSPLFHGLTPQQIEQLFETASYSVEDYPAEALVAKRDMPYSGLMIILRGSVRGEVPGTDHRRRIIDNISAVQLIAPAFLFGGYNRLPMDVVTNESTQILTLHRGTIFDMMQQNYVVMSNFIDIISNRANYFSRKIYTLSVLMLNEKIAAMILAAAAGTDVAVLPVESITRELSITRNAAEQSLNELIKRGYIAMTEGDEIRILNRQGLTVKNV